MTGQVYVDLPKAGLVRRQCVNPFAESEEVSPLPPKRRENTYRDEAVDDWVTGRRATVATYYEGRLIRFFDRGGWGEWEQIA